MKQPLIITLAAAILTAACDQAPIFWTIANEVKPQTAKIAGGPSKIVKDRDGNLYIANGDLWQYSGGNWHKFSAPPGVVRDVAADEETRDVIFAYTNDNKSGDTAIWKYSGGTWNIIASAPSLGWQNIFSANGTLFATRRGDGDPPSNDAHWYSIYTCGSSDNTLSMLYPNTSILTGVVYANGAYIIATLRDKVFVLNGTPQSPPTISASAFKGIINTGSDIAVAVTSDGTLYQIATTGGVNVDGVSYNALDVLSTTYDVDDCTGALAVWEMPGDNTQRLLLVGLYAGGYREFQLTQEGVLSGGNYAPGSGSPSSMDSNDKYVATVKEYPLTAIFQAPHDETVGGGSTLPVVFAATQMDGLFSLRYDSDDGVVWNAEN
jgi:hypothetical protein